MQAPRACTLQHSHWQRDQSEAVVRVIMRVRSSSCEPHSARQRAEMSTRIRCTARRALSLATLLVARVCRVSSHTMCYLLSVLAREARSTT